MNELRLPPHPEITRNRRRLALGGLLFVGLIVAAGGVLGYRHLAIEKDLAARRSAAVEVLKGDSRDVEQAVNDLKEVVQRHPKDVEAISALARLLLRRSPERRENVIDAVRYYNSLLEIEPDRYDERFEMIRLLDLLGESDALAKLIGPLIELRPQDPILHELRTLHLIRLARSKEAEAAAQQWSEAATDDFKAQMTYVSLLSANGKDQHESDSYLNKKLSANPNQDMVTLVRAVWLLGANQSQEGTRLIGLLASKPNRDPRLTRALVTTLDQLSRRQEADTLLADALASGKDDSLVVMAVFRDIDRSDYSQAMALLERASKPADLSRRSVLLCVKAFLARKLNRADVVETALAELQGIPIQYSGPWRAILKATQSELLATNDARELLPQLRVSALIEDAGALLQLATANCLARIDQQRLADRMLVEASRSPIGWSLSARRLVELRRSRGEIVQAVEVAQYAFNRSGRTIDSAIYLALAVAESKPTGLQADNHLQLLREIQRAVPGEVQTLGLFVDSLAERGDASAQAVLGDALNRDTPIPAEILLQWGELSQRRGLGLESECLKRAQLVGGLTPRIALARALVAHRAGNTNKALSELRDAREQHPDARRGYDEAIASFLLQVRSPDAAEAWNALAAANPQDVSLQVRVLELGFGGSADEVRALIDRIRKVEPGNFAAEMADIRLALAEQNDATSIDNAILRLTRIVDRMPDLVPARLLLIEVLSRTNNANAALAQWERAYAIEPNDPSILLSGSQLLIANGNRARATETLQKIDRFDANLSPSQRFEAARLYLVLGLVQRTIEILQPMNDLPRNGQLLLAEACFRSGDATKGHTILDRLLAVPDLDTLLFAAAIEDSQQNKEAAGALLQRAQDLTDLTEADRLRVAEFASERGGLERVIGLLSTSNVSNEMTIRIARLWIEQGEVDAAMKALNEAASKSADTGALRRRIKEEPQIRRLIQLGLRQVASELVASPDDAATQQMVQFAVMTQTQSVRDQQIALDRLAEQDAPNYAVQMFVADRYLAANQPGAAERHARVAAQVRPSAPQPLAVAALCAFRAGNTGRCAEAIRDWRNRLPADNTQPDGIEVRNLARRREYTELLARYEPKVTAAGGKPSVDIVFAVAEAMHARGRDDDAFQLLKPVIESSSRLAIAWVGTVSREVNPASAWRSLNACRVVADRRQIPMERVAIATALDRIARKTKDPAQLEVAAKAIADVEALANELPLECVVQLAENRGERGELKLAEAIYRRSLTSRQDVAMLLNNLAEVLRRQSRLDDALATIDQALAANSGDASMYDTRASILQDSKRLDDALAAAQAALKLEPLNPKWLLRVTTIYQAKGDWVTARASLDTLRWFFREPEAWSPDLIDRFTTLQNSLARRPATAPSK